MDLLYVSTELSSTNGLYVNIMHVLVIASLRDL
jgi:hypothetical protein